MDNIKSAFSEIGKRFSHPILGPFILSWCTLNWEFLYYIAFANETANVKIHVASNHYLSGVYYFTFISFSIAILSWTSSPFIAESTKALFTFAEKFVFYKYRLNFKIKKVRDEIELQSAKQELQQKQEETASLTLDSIKREIKSLEIEKRDIESQKNSLEESISILDSAVLELQMKKSTLQKEENENQKKNKERDAHIFWIIRDLTDSAMFLAGGEEKRYIKSLKQTIWHYKEAGFDKENSNLYRKLVILLKKTSEIPSPSSHNEINSLTLEMLNFINNRTGGAWSNITGKAIAPEDWDPQL